MARWIIASRWWLIALMALLAVISGAGLWSMSIDSDLRVFFPKQDPRLKELEKLENIYTKTETIIFIVEPRSGDVFSRATLAAVQSLTDACWQIPFANRVDSVSNFQYTEAHDDELTVGDFIVHPDTLDNRTLAIKRRDALQEPLLVNRLLSSDAATTAVVANIIFSDKSPDAVATVAEHARQLRDDFRRRYPDIRFFLTGSVMFDMAFSEVGRHDMSVLAPVMFFVLTLVVGLSVRSLVATVVTMAIVFLSMLSAMGIAGWLGISLNPASANAPTVILTLAVADSVHILITLYRLMYAGKSKHDALVESLTINLQAVFLTSITTVIGFLTMNMSDVPPFHDLGNIVAIGISMAFIYSVFLLPPLIAVLPVTVKRAPVTSDRGIFDRLSVFVSRYQNSIIGVLGVTVVAGAMLAPRNVLNDNWVHYFSTDIPVRVATDVMESKLTGSDYIDYSLPAGASGAIADPAYLKRLDAFANWLRRQPEVMHVYSVADIFKRLNSNMHNDDPSFYRLPDNRKLAAQFLLLYEMSLPLGLDLNNQINIDKSATRIIVTVKNQGTRILRTLDQRAQQWLRDNMPDYMHIRGSGLSIVWAYLSERNIKSMLFAAFTALILISLVMIVALRRLDMGLISLVPNLTPALIAFGIWALFVGEVGLGLSVVTGMTLGIIVDDTVHFMSKYLRFRKSQHMSAHEAIRATFCLVGPAMAVTTIALVAGFMVLTFSDYKMSADMGLLSAITISVALVMDFLLLPALLLKISSGANP